MVKRKIVWSHRAKIKLYKILEFFANRNQSKTYSAKLYNRFTRELELVNKHPDLGIRTDIDGVRGLIAGDYIIFYECPSNLSLSTQFGIAGKILTI